jgi:serine/threonine-protein kinase
MSDVYIAEDQLLERPVIVKLLSERLLGEASARERMAREARIGARLGQHPHVITVHDTGVWKGRPFIVMELASNGSIRERLEREGAPTPAQAMRWLRQTAEALDAAHERGVVHRDLKPGNLLLDEQDNVRIADFGVAWHADQQAVTCDGEVMGTAGYLAPEQAAGAPATAESDLYAFAVVAHELLTGKLPHSRDALSLDPAVQDVLARALAPEPARRPATAGDLVAELEHAFDAAAPITKRFIRGRSLFVSTRPSSRWRRRLVLAAVGTTAAFGGVVAGALIGYDVAGGDASVAGPRQPVRCALSTLDNDANVVVAGADAITFCREQVRALSATGDPWGFRSGARLIAPNTGDTTALSVVCTLRENGLSLRVYDDATQRIGHDVCRHYELGGWEITSFS